MKIPTAVKSFLWMVPYWLIVMSLFYLFRFYGLEQTPGITVDVGSPITTASGLIIIRVGIVAAFVYTLVERIGDLHVVKKRPYGIVLLTKVASAFLLILLVSFLVLKFIVPFDVYQDSDILKFKPFWTLLAYFTCMSALASFVRMMVQKIGKGPFIRLLMGRYRKPKHERRVFLFLDLKSSVRYAQKLGHLRYSHLIQECFYDLDLSVNKYQGEIYQYVGDEAVVTWSYSTALKDDNCVKCFLSFQERMHQRRSFYLTKFQFVPVFKAGLHGGSLTVAEVGGEKKEIAYYGDVINTASRIQEQCNRLGQNFLVSSTLAADLHLAKYTPLGSIELKGRSAPIELMAIKQV